MVAAARRNLAPLGGRATAEVGDVAALPFPDRSFDLVVSSLSLHHWQDPQGGAVELGRVRRADRCVCVYDFRSAPFDALISACESAAVLLAAPPQRTELASGVPFVKLVRLVLSS